MRFHEKSVVLVNLIGGILACVLAYAGIWQMFLVPKTASAELKDLRAILADRTQDMTTLEHELGKQKDLLEQREAELESRGAPPTQTPIEDDLRTITELAQRNGLHLMNVTPAGSVEYPGIREIQYHVTCCGIYTDLAKMLRQFEACDFWGDITCLKIESAKNTAGCGPNTRQMELTVSFYSAVPVLEPTDTR